MRKLAFSLLLLALQGCASNSGIVPTGQDSFMISRQAGSGFAGLGTMKADNFHDASDYCMANKKQVQVVSTNDSQPPYILGNFPRSEIQFKCIDTGK